MLLEFASYTSSEKRKMKIVQDYDWIKLEEFWHKIKEGKTKWSSGKALEYMFVRAFDLEGAEVVYPYNNKINNKAQEQFDGFVFIKELGAGFLIECKDWKDKVAFEELAKLHGRLTYRFSSTYGLFLSRNDFTASAVELMYMMYPHNILLWSFDEIDECFKKHKFLKALKFKYQYAMVTADPMIAVLDGINI